MAWWRLVVCVLIGVCVTGCAPMIPAPARLVFATPAPDSVVGVLPTVLQLHFNQALLASQSSARLLDETGQPLGGVGQVNLDPTDARALTLQLQPASRAGRFTVEWQAISAETHSASSGTFDFMVQPGQPATPQVTVSPAPIDVKQTLAVVGTGFGSQRSITLTIGDDDEPLGSAATDTAGAFTQSVTIPEDIPFGQQPVWARDETGTRAGAVVEVRWGGWPPLHVYTLATPGPDRGQVTFTVVGRNESDYVLDGVRVRLILPDGTSVISASEGAQQQDGTLIWDEGVVDRTSLTPRTAIVSVEGAVVGGARVEFRHRRPSGCIGDQCLPAFVDETYSASGPVTPVS